MDFISITLLILGVSGFILALFNFYYVHCHRRYEILELRRLQLDRERYEARLRAIRIPRATYREFLIV